MRRLLILLFTVIVSTQGTPGGYPGSPAAGARQAAAGSIPDAPRPAPRFEEALALARELPRLHSLLISVDGRLLLEQYFNGANRPANVKSVSKSIISALTGIAIERGLIPSVDTAIVTWFPELKKSKDEARRAITVEHLLTMTSGLESTSNRNYGAWVSSRNWVQHVLTRPLLAPPGKAMDYSTGNTHLLSAILTKATGRNTWQFAQETLAAPLGFTLARWPRDPQGIYFGGNDMELTPRQMLAFGELYLNLGRMNDRQIVPRAWIDASLVSRGRSSWSGNEYGYGWWLRDLSGFRSFHAWGFGGQYIIVIPDLKMVVVTTSAATVAEDRRSHRRTVFGIVENLIVPAVADTSGDGALPKTLRGES
ncbi:MAG TPA: serine hydrolase [Vicinamibacterales bacterium]|nr:serine hydrolase [Vicinamibacterales bacterium]